MTKINKIIFWKTNFNNDIDVYMNKEKIHSIKEANYKWKYFFTNVGKYNYEIIFNGNITNIALI